MVPCGVLECAGLTVCLEINKNGGDAEHIVAHCYYDAIEKILKTDGVTEDGLTSLDRLDDLAE